MLLVASNAAVGGPSTAATFAESLRLAQLVVPAAVCGTLGYAIGTPIAFEAWTTSVAIYFCDILRYKVKIRSYKMQSGCVTLNLMHEHRSLLNAARLSRV